MTIRSPRRARIARVGERLTGVAERPDAFAVPRVVAFLGVVFLGVVFFAAGFLGGVVFFAVGFFIGVVFFAVVFFAPVFFRLAFLVLVLLAMVLFAGMVRLPATDSSFPICPYFPSVTLTLG